MSDFGSAVLVWRVDGQSVSPEDKDRLQEAVQAAKGEPQRDRFGRFDEFECRIGGYGLPGGGEGFSVILTRHFLEEEGDPEAVLADQEPLTQEFADELARILGEEYETRAISSFW